MTFISKAKGKTFNPNDDKKQGDENETNTWPHSLLLIIVNLLKVDYVLFIHQQSDLALCFKYRANYTKSISALL